MMDLNVGRNRYQPPERRRHPRAQLSMVLHGIRMDPEGDIKDTLHMVDISRSGLGAISDRPLYPGQRILLCLPMHPEGRRRQVYASVVRCQKLSEGYRVGIQFDSVNWAVSAATAPVAVAA